MLVSMNRAGSVPMMGPGYQPESSHVSSMWIGGSVRSGHSTHSPQRAVCVIHTRLFFHCSGTHTWPFNEVPQLKF